MIAPRRTTIRTAAAATALSLALAGCGSGSRSRSAAGTIRNRASTAAKAGNAPRTGTVSVAISNYSYSPDTITVAGGTTVTFTNHDQTAHTATSTAPGFDSGILKPGKGFSIHLDKPGRYTFYCQFHAFMRGTIIVR